MRILPGTRFFLKLALICGLAVFFIVYPGEFTFQWFGYKATMPIALLLGILFGIMAILIFVYQCWHWFTGIPGRTKVFFQKRRIKKFEDVVIEGFTAIAAQQPDEAQSAADLARGLSPNHPLALFLTGQTSYLNQDFALAQSTFALMAEHQQLRFLGLRGTAMLAMDRKDWTRVQTTLLQLYEIRPDSPWVLKQLEINSLKLALVDTQNTAVDMLPFYRHLPKSSAQNHQGLLLWIKLKHNPHATLTDAERLDVLKMAHSVQPANPVIATTLAYALFNHHHKHKALRVLQRTFKMAPHRLVGEAWLHIHQPKTPIESYQKMVKLTVHHPEHDESYWLLAKAALDADLWGQARHHIAPLLHDMPTMSVYTLMTEIEAREYPDQPFKADFWHQKKETVHHEWDWSCQHCGHGVSTWDAYCTACGHFGRIEWHKRVAPESAPLNRLNGASTPLILS